MVCRSVPGWRAIRGILLTALICFMTIKGRRVDGRHGNVCFEGGLHCSEGRSCMKSSYRCGAHPECRHGDDDQHCGYFLLTNSMNGRERRDAVAIRNSISSHQPVCIEEGFSSVLKSLQMTVTSPNCALLFNFYSNGNGILAAGTTQLVRNEYVESVLWQQELVPEMKWQQGLIDVGQRAHGWSLFFRTDQSCVTIDNIRFQNCSFSRQVESCGVDQFKCRDGGCIHYTHICNFAKDCLDGSDESADTCEHYVGRCNFEESFCDWSQDRNDDFDWSRGNGLSGGSPSIDHTTGTSKGFLVYVDASAHVKHKVARLISPVFKKGNTNCQMQLYYHLEFNYNHTLSVKRRVTNNSIVSMELIESLKGQDMRIWKRAVIDLTTEEDFQVVLEATIGSGKKGVVAIDDISFDPFCIPDATACKDYEFSCGDGQCVPCVDNYCVCDFVTDCSNKADEKYCQSSCDFEQVNATCGWKNAETNSINWVVHKGYTPSNATGPPYDHTKGTKQGHFLYVDGQQKVAQNFPLAFFVSPIYKHGTYDCKFSFWYNMYHERVVDHNDVILYAIYRSRSIDGKTRDTTLWMEAHTTYIQWKQAVIQLPRCPREFNIILKGEHYWNSHTDVAVDDLKFMCTEKPPEICNNLTEFQCNITKQCVPLDSICDIDRNCCDGSDESEELCRGYSKLDFENGMEKGWMHLNNELFDFTFTLNRGPTETPKTGPATDHTFQEDHGTYIYTEATSKIQNQTAAIASPTIAATNSKNSSTNASCMVRFWYHMYGSTMGALTVYTATVFGKPEKEMWSLSGSQGDVWKRGSIHLSSENDFQVIFKATIGKDSLSDVALDDVSFTPGCILTGKTLRGGPVPSPTTSCPPKFYCQKNNSCLPMFEVCDFEIDCPEGGEDESDAECGYPQGFEHGFGAWKHPDDKLKFPIEFTLRKGSTPTLKAGPSTDARGNVTGHYIYLQTIGRSTKKSAVLGSPWYKSAYSECKLNLFYNIFGKNKKIFKIVLVDKNMKRTDMLDFRDAVRNQWHEINITIGRRREAFKIDFHVEVYGDKGGVAIDELNFLHCGSPPYCPKDTVGQFRCRNKRCVASSSICDLTDDCGDLSDEDPLHCLGYTACNFDSPPLLCNFIQDSNDDFNWTVKSGQTKSLGTGPTHDHTTKTAKGNYLYIEASDRKIGVKARLRSLPITVRPNAGCKMKFHYHMFGTGLGRLNVNVFVNNTRLLRNEFLGPSKFIWREAEIDFSKERHTFQVEFEGVIGRNHEGDIAIDDIIFTPGCSFPPNATYLAYPRTVPCEGQFECALTGNCIPTGLKCNNNGTWDCKDGSDEEGCDPSHHVMKQRRGVRNNNITIVVPLMCLLVLLIVAGTIIQARRGRTEKFHLFSIFYNPYAIEEPGPQVIKQVKKASTISSVSNPVYDNPSEKGEKDSVNTPSYPLYQEPFFLSRPDLH